jgi:hypothetical protein
MSLPNGFTSLTKSAISYGIKFGGSGFSEVFLSVTGRCVETPGRLIQASCLAAALVRRMGARLYGLRHVPFGT